MTVRWLTEEEVLSSVNPALSARGWAELNTATARVLGAFHGDALTEVFVIQLHPLVGPLLRLDNTIRDDGSTSRELCRRMEEYLKENDARGWLVIAETPFTERLCERYGMKRVEFPVFMEVG